MDTRILIVADDRLARAGLAAILTDRPGFAIVGQIASADLQGFAWDVHRPDLVLWDLGWDADAALALVADAQAGGVPVVALLPDSYAAQVSPRDIQGLLPRDVEPETLVAALLATKHGLVVMATPFVAALKSADTLTIPTLAEPLTRRELDVLHLLAEGLGNKAIAQRLGISEHTVKFHINAILGKVGAQSRTEAVVRAMRLGLVSV